MALRGMARVNASVESLTSLYDARDEAERRYRESQRALSIRFELAGETLIREAQGMLNVLEGTRDVSAVSHEVGRFRQLVRDFERRQALLPEDQRVATSTTRTIYDLLARLNAMDRENRGEGPSRRR